MGKLTSREPRVERFRDLFPEIPEDERAEAEATFDRYLRGALKRYQSLLGDPARYAHFKRLTMKALDGIHEGTTTP